MAPAFNLYYFDAMGRAELIRLIFNYAGVAFNDVRIQGDWSALKARTPFGQLPVLEEDGRMMAQSMAIARYLARKFGLSGANEIESAQADMYIDSISDLFNASVPILLERDETKQIQMNAAFLAEKIVPYVDRIEKHLAKNRGQYLVGKSLTWADLALMNFFNFYVQRAPDLLKAAPHMKQLIHRVAAIPNIKKWIEKRPKNSI